ncbi:MAG: CAP domain-containing protein [Pseudanabaena sp. CRU_2_10]|nr:CAP domain-containing protein [Pseudanabaena sp. CRU_2_10]
MTTNATFISEVLKLTNEFRAQNGLPALKSNAELQATAQGHSQDTGVSPIILATLAKMVPPHGIEPNGLVMLLIAWVKTLQPGKLLPRVLFKDG